MQCFQVLATQSKSTVARNVEPLEVKHGVEGLTGVNLGKLNPKISPDACKTYCAMYTGQLCSSHRHAVQLKQKNKNYPVT